MPGNAQKGNYILKLEGSEYGSTSGNIFYNETSLEFDPKQASLFIQLSKPIYRQSQTGKSFYFECTNCHFIFLITDLNFNILNFGGTNCHFFFDDTGLNFNIVIFILSNFIRHTCKNHS
jgi:hypothetical protein